MNKSSLKSHFSQGRRGLSFTGLALAAIIGVLGAAGPVVGHAQSTSGSIFGTVPAGDTVIAKSTTNGTRRYTTADSNGRYSLKALPVGTYNVVLEVNGKPVIQHLNVPVGVGRGIKVDFDCSDNKCGAQ